MVVPEGPLASVNDRVGQQPCGHVSLLQAAEVPRLIAADAGLDRGPLLLLDHAGHRGQRDGP
ncbi:hypothetical protein [Cryobacterium sp. M96]|uniref:hypothetical protein n=1 Tax=Cryobacterium sp. M96 TaxID=2048295 RepID=UPI000CE328D4|nr:hypothetical protein [Cryobacterium sp. M96]